MKKTPLKHNPKSKWATLGTKGNPRSTLRKVSNSPWRRAKRFVPPHILKAIHKRSGRRCETSLVASQCELMPWHPWTVANQCNSLLVIRCHRKALRQPHHIKKRSQGGLHTLDNLMAVCFECHHWIENNKRLALKHGLTRI